MPPIVTEHSITVKPGDNLQISYIGYERRLITDLQPGNANTVVLMDQRLEVVTLGMVVTVKKKKKKSTPPLIAEPGIHSGVSGLLKIYPNPLTSGQPLTVECKKIEHGPCSIFLLALSGQTVYQQEGLPAGKKNQVTLNLPSLRSGEYILVVTHQQTGKKYTGKIIIQ
jgi:Secretion system C-terminal sorting domain